MTTEGAGPQLRWVDNNNRPAEPPPKLVEITAAIRREVGPSTIATMTRRSHGAWAVEAFRQRLSPGSGPHPSPDAVSAEVCKILERFGVAATPS